MKNKITVIVALFLSCSLLAQDVPSKPSSDSISAADTYSVDPYSPYTSMYDTSLVTRKPIRPASESKIPSPTIGVGIGLFSFYGDVLNFQSPTTSRTAYEVILTQPINNYFFANFSMLFGKIGANERFTSTNRNANFESEIRAGSFTIGYNFGNFISTKRLIYPYIIFGIESFEFLSKTDLYDKNGNKYYYWSDGSVRNMDENETGASTSSVILKRDYNYESDVREINVQQFGKYPERSWAMPVGGGFSIQINDFIDFRISSVMHIAFTDYIDGVVEKNTSRKIIKGKNDYFLMSSCGLTYNFGIKKIAANPIIEKIETENADFYAMDTGDKDKDGIADILDKCQNTPEGIVVDSLGCPLDADKDGIADYKDKELNTPKDAIIDNKGIQLNDSTIAMYYKKYTDSTAYATVEELDAYVKIELPDLYIVSLGSYDKGLPIELLTKFLSIHDIQTIKITEKKSMYTAGTYDNLEDAETRKQQLIDAGITNVKVMLNENGVYRSIQTASRTTNTRLQAYKTVKSAPKPLPDIALTETAKQQSTVKQIPQPTPIITTEMKSKADSAAGIAAITAPVKTLPIESAITIKDTLNILAKETTKETKLSLPQIKKDTIASAGIANTTQVKTTPKVVSKDTANTVETTPTISTVKAIAAVTTTTTTENKPNDIKAIVPITTTVISVPEIAATAAAPISSKTTTITSEDQHNSELKGPEIVYRIQLGVYPIPLSQNVFAGLKDIVEITTENGLYKYTSHSFETMESAAKFRIDMILRGYEGAFITAYKGGERITLEQAGATITSGSKPAEEISDTVKINVANKNLISFKVQIGVYKDTPPADKLKMFEALKSKGLSTEKTISGLTRYTIGNFTSYLKAEEYRYELIKKYDLTDPFVVAQFNDEYITVQEALELLK
jgi:hypothetical protein